MKRRFNKTFLVTFKKGYFPGFCFLKSFWTALCLHCPRDLAPASSQLLTTEAVEHLRLIGKNNLEKFPTDSLSLLQIRREIHSHTPRPVPRPSKIMPDRLRTKNDQDFGLNQLECECHAQNCEGLGTLDRIRTTE